MALFTIYREENYIREEIFLPFRDGLIHNTPISIASIFQLLYDAEIMPSLLSSDKVLDLCSAVCCFKSELSSLFYKRRDLRVFRSLKSIFQNPNQISKIDLQLSQLTNDPKCYFFEFCLFFLLLSYILAKTHTTKRDSKTLFKILMNKILHLAPDNEFMSKTFIPSTSFAKNVKHHFKDCFRTERNLKKDYSSLLNVSSDNNNSSQTEIVNSIRVKSILSTLTYKSNT